MNKKKKGNICIIAGLVLVVAALCLIGYNIFAQWNAGNASYNVLIKIDEVRAEREQAAESALSEDLQAVEPAYIENPLTEMPVISIDGNDYIGIIIIPSLNLELPVLGEWSYAGLQIAPCRYTGSVYQNNLVICAHNYDSHFGRINTLYAGDEVIFIDNDGNIFDYQVVNMEIIEPTDIEDMVSADDWGLTLFTCNMAGSARVTVRCELIK